MIYRDLHNTTHAMLEGWLVTLFFNLVAVGTPGKTGQYIPHAPNYPPAKLAWVVLYPGHVMDYSSYYPEGKM